MSTKGITFILRYKVKKYFFILPSSSIWAFLAGSWTSAVILCSLHVTLVPCSTTEMNATAIKYILISAKTIDTILTIALFYCEWNNINDDDGIIYGMIMASIICRGILNSCAFKKNTNYALKYFGQALQLVPIGLLIAAIIICIIKNRYVSMYL